MKTNTLFENVYSYSKILFKDLLHYISFDID